MKTEISQDRVVPTGGNGDFYLFKHLILTEAELNRIVDLTQLAKRLEIDFISVQKKGTIEFKHVTSTDNELFIMEHGLHQKKDNWISDLGSGLYVIEKTNVDASENLSSFIAEHYDDDSHILIVEGTYTGDYIECVFGNGHEGYIVIHSDFIPLDCINDIFEKGIEEYLWFD